jgi:nucleotide-binding universal stress UspA family protein
MRIVLALDGSPQADHARAFTVSVDWPAGTQIEVLAVLRSQPAFGLLDPSHAALDRARTALLAVVHEAAASLEDAGLNVRTRVVVGRPASAIVDEAGRFRADLVVVGSRGFGPIPSMLLGSVSSEVADRAPCPVLVVRRDRCGVVVVAVDGSASAQAAVDYLAGFRLLASKPTTVVSVVPPLVSILDPVGGLGDGMYDAPPEQLAHRGDEARAEHESAADSAAAQLRDAGYLVTSDVRQGDPAHEIIRLGEMGDDPVLVLGTRGQTGLTRAVIGSVARNVLLHAAGSVLIVRGPVRERAGDGSFEREESRPGASPRMLGDLVSC